MRYRLNFASALGSLSISLLLFLWIPSEGIAQATPGNLKALMIAGVSTTLDKAAPGYKFGLGAEYMIDSTVGFQGSICYRGVGVEHGVEFTAEGGSTSFYSFDYLRLLSFETVVNLGFSRHFFFFIGASVDRTLSISSGDGRDFTAYYKLWDLSMLLGVSYEIHPLQFEVEFGFPIQNGYYNSDWSTPLEARFVTTFRFF